MVTASNLQQPHTTWFGKHSIIPQVTINWDLKAVFSWMVVVTTQIIPPQQRRYRKRGSETWKQRFCWVLSFFLKASCFQAAPTRPTELLLYSYSTSPVLAGNFKLVVLPTAKVFFLGGGGAGEVSPPAGHYKEHRCKAWFSRPGRSFTQSFCPNVVTSASQQLKW